MTRAFNGSSDMIDPRPSSAKFADATAFSAFAWVKQAAIASKAVFNQGNTTNLQDLVLASDGSTGSKLRVLLVDTVGTKIDDSAGAKTPFDGTWHPVGLTFDTGRNWVRYTDGAADGGGAYAAASLLSMNISTIGAVIRDSNSIIFSFGGLLAHVAFWQRTLSAGEMKSLGNGLLPSRLAPDDYWPLLGSSPEPSIGIGTHQAGVLTGTTVATGPPASLGLLRS